MEHILSSPRFDAIFSQIAPLGLDIKIVGGAVRDAWLGREIGDIDLCSPKHPDEIKAICARHEIKTVPTGFEHGTQMLLLDSEAVEITSFRRDILTDGRRAQVEFFGTLAEDAHRRDFTLNALYLDEVGQIFDPTLQGLDDLDLGILRFVGDPTTRIREDYLRILRFFRFLSVYGFAPDPEGLEAVIALSPGLREISAERIQAEMKKMLIGDDALRWINYMSEKGVLSHIAPEPDIKRYESFRKKPLLTGLARDWRVEAALLFGLSIGHLWRLSNKDNIWMKRFLSTLTKTYSVVQMTALYGEDIAAWAQFFREGRVNYTDIDQAARTKFPIKAQDLFHLVEKRELGILLKRLYEIWVESDLKLDRETLLRTARALKEKL